MNSDINRKSSREIKNEVMNDLKKLNQDFEQLKEHMTPGQIIDDVLFYRQIRSPRESFNYLKDNPVGTSFLALGTLLLMEDQRNRSFEGVIRDKGSSYIESARHGVEDMKAKVDGVKSKVQGVASTIKSKMPGKGHDVSEGTSTQSVGPSEYGISSGTAGAMADDFKRGAAEGVDSAKAKISSASDSVKGSVSSVKDQFRDIKEGVSAKMPDLKDKASKGMETVKGQVREGYESMRSMEPLTYVALGAGLGTLTGMSLPLADKEKTLADDKLDTVISEFTRDLEQALNQSANIFKNEFLNDITGFNLNIFGGSGSEERRSAY